MLEGGDIEGIKVMVYCNELINSIIDWMIVWDDNIYNIFFFVYFWNFMVRWVLFVYFFINVVLILENLNNCFGDF